MPQDCPECSRPNGDAAQRCLYCGATLEPQVTQAGDGDVRQEQWPDSYSVVITQGAESIQADAFAALTSRPAGWLMMGTPLTVGIFADLDEASSLQRELSGAGIGATVVADARLGDMGPMLVARRANVARGGMEFVSAESKKQMVLLRDLAIAVRATVADPESVDDAGRLRARSISGRTYTPISGGTNRVNALDLHSRSAPPVRIVAERFDYAILGGNLMPSASANFESLVQMVRDHAPQVRYDTSFARLDPADGTPEARRLEIYGRRLLAAVIQAG